MPESPLWWNLILKSVSLETRKLRPGKRKIQLFNLRYIEKQLNANEVAPNKTRCLDFDWRSSLKTGDEIDACDTTSVWYNATVLDSRENGEGDKAYKEIKIGKFGINGLSFRLQNL